MGYGGTILIPHSPDGEPSITGVIKSRNMRWAMLVERLGEMKNTYKISVRKFEGKRVIGNSNRSPINLLQDLQKYSRIYTDKR
jgi:hypothetical protein